MGPIKIRPVESARDRAAFMMMPWEIYGDCPNWVPPLLSDQKSILDPAVGPFYRNGEVKLWLAERNGRPVGRISSHLSARHDQLIGGSKGYFGFFECEDNQETARALFEAAETHLRSKARTEVEGPYNFTIYDEIGILVDGFDTPPAIMVRHNPAYYQRLIESLGYEKAVDWHAYRCEVSPTQLSERMGRIAMRIENRKEVNIREVNLRAYDQDARTVKRLFDLAWRQNWGHIPLSDEEFWYGAKGLKMLIVPGLSYIVEVKGEPIGIAISVYDINPLIKRIDGRLLPFGFLRLMLGVKKMKRFRMLLMGVDPKHRGRGYEIAMYAKAIRKATSLSFDEAEMSLILENNEPMMHSIQQLSSQLAKRLRIYRKDLC
ncbi:MAG: hypothetical protein KDB22_10275 [Planctomycetales bacterium]|nr:hypothetical protein [Planctomycetales bacterium]